MNKKAESDSPSKLFAREVGEPIAQGITEGFVGAKQVVSDAVAEFTTMFLGFFKDTVDSWVGFRDDVVEQARLMVEGVSTQFDAFATDALPKVLEFHTNVTDEFAAMNNDIAVIAVTMATNVTTIATVLSGTLAQIASTVNSFTSPTGTQGVPSVVNNVSRTNNFNLNVISSTPSQGIIGDFTILQVLAAGA
jgi:hypothetical protein